jgi:hypothetical protein
MCGVTNPVSTNYIKIKNVDNVISINVLCYMPVTFRVLAGIRTQDPILKRDVLYLLSY